MERFWGELFDHIYVLNTLVSYSEEAISRDGKTGRWDQLGYCKSLVKNVLKF